MTSPEQAPFTGLEVCAGFSPSALDPLKDTIKAHLPSFLPYRHESPENRRITCLARIEAASGTRPRTLEEMIAEISNLSPQPGVVQRLGIVARNGLVSLEVEAINLQSLYGRLEDVDGKNLRSRFRLRDLEERRAQVGLGTISRVVPTEGSPHYEAVKTNVWAKGVLPVSLCFDGIFKGHDVHTSPAPAEQK